MKVIDIMCDSARLLGLEEECEMLCDSTKDETSKLANQTIKQMFELAKLSINRYRPMCYFESGDSYDSYKDDGDFANSFPSGHSTMAFAGAAFSSYVFWKYFPESPLRYAVCAGSFSFAAATAVSRVLSGNHFVSDVAVGALIGSCTGFLVPFLHQSKKAETNENIQVGILPNGFLMRLNF